LQNGSKTGQRASKEKHVKRLLAILLLIGSLAAPSIAQEQSPTETPYTMELPSGSRIWFRNPDG